MLSTLLYTLAFLNTTAYDEYRNLSYRNVSYGLPYCIVQLGLEEQIYDLFDFTYPPMVMQTTQEQTNYAFIMLKYTFMHDIVPCIKTMPSDLYSQKKTEMRYDKMHLKFTGYLMEGLRHHYDVDLMNYPMFERYFAIELKLLRDLSEIDVETRPVFPVGNMWKRAYYFYIEQWYAYLKKHYRT